MKTDTHLINILTETAPCFEIFCITKITVRITFTLHATPDKFLGHPTESEEAKKRHINIFCLQNIDPVADHTAILW